MSEHPPQNQNIDKTPKFSKERTPYSVEDESLAHYIHNETGGEGASSEHINELIDVANEKIDTKRDFQPENPDSPEGKGSPDLNPDGESAQEQATEQARVDVEKALNDQESDVEGGGEKSPDFKGNDDETKLMNELAENVPKPELAPEDVALYEQIDAIDAMSNYKLRTKKLREFALRNNGKLDSMGVDVGVEAAKRLRTSHVRSKLSPRRYTLKLGSARRQCNGLLTEMAKGGPNGANLTAALAMKRNWDPGYFRNEHVPGKNKVIYEVAKTLERQIAELPDEIRQAQLKLQSLQEEETPRPDKIASEIETIKMLIEKLDYSKKSTENIEEYIDMLLMHGHKYRGDVIANRAITRKDLSILDEINSFGNLRKKQEAIGEIIIKMARDTDELSKEDAARYKVHLLSIAREKIKNKKIRDRVINKLS